MNAGLPSTGIGGFFYLLIAIAMPFNEAILSLRGKSNKKRWLVVFKQSSIAWGIISAIWITGDIIGILVKKPAHLTTNNLQTIQSYNIITVKPIVLSSATLIFVILVVHILMIIQNIKNRV
jgi:hypothetical protein